jgi:hypothetical protein
MAWGFSLFCDDLRAEWGGKVSIMGVYSSDMIIYGDFPHVLPKFSIFLLYYEDIDESDDDITARVYLPGEDGPTIEITLPRKDLPPPAPATDLEPDQTRLCHLRLPITMQPLVVKQAGYLKVRVARGEEIHNFGSLRIRKPTTEEAAALFGGQPPAPFQNPNLIPPGA